MSEEIKIVDGAFSKDNPHKDIGKQKFRVRKAYTAWVEYDVVAETKDEAIDAVIEHGGIDKIEWSEGYHKDEPVSANFNEQVKQTENDELVMALEADGIEEIAQINNALQRIEEGTYLQCVNCGEDIGEERLQAIPYADRCIDCAQ